MYLHIVIIIVINFIISIIIVIQQIDLNIV
jgi:hypothetical protein